MHTRVTNKTTYVIDLYTPRYVVRISNYVFDFDDISFFFASNCMKKIYANF